MLRNRIPCCIWLPVVEIPQVVQYIGVGFSAGLFVLCIGIVFVTLKRGISSMSSVD